MEILEDRMSDFRFTPHMYMIFLPPSKSVKFVTSDKRSALRVTKPDATLKLLGGT